MTKVKIFQRKDCIIFEFTKKKGWFKKLRTFTSYPNWLQAQKMLQYLRSQNKKYRICEYALNNHKYSE